MVYVVVVLGIATMISFLEQYFRLKPAQVLTYKIATSIFFVLIAIVGFAYNHVATRYFIFILAGAIAGLFGDFFLGMKDIKKKNKDKYLLAGILLFFVGHINYIIAITEILHYPWYIYLIISALVFSMVTIYIVNQKLTIAKHRFIHFLYIVPSAILFSVAWLHVFNGWYLYTWIMALGVLLFVASDILLVQVYYKKFPRKEYKKLKRINLTLYYLGQFAIALSVYFFV